MTIQEYLISIGITDPDIWDELSIELRCEICNSEIEKNLSPTNPACEGNWCQEALELWLESEYTEDLKDYGI